MNMPTIEQIKQAVMSATPDDIVNEDGYSIEYRINPTCYISFTITVHNDPDRERIYYAHEVDISKAYWVKLGEEKWQPVAGYTLDDELVDKIWQDFYDYDIKENYNTDYA